MTKLGWLLLGLCLAGSARAQITEVYLFLDRPEPDPGCVVVLGAPATTVTGVDSQVRAVLDTASGAVTAVGVRRCEGGALGPENLSAPAGHAIGFADGVANADVVEISVADQLLSGQGGAGTAVVSAAAVSGASVDVALGESLSIAPAMVPAVPLWAGLVLALVVARTGFAGLRRRRGLAAAGLVVVSLGAWAAEMVLDGLIEDWDGIAPRLDPPGDATIGGPASDITAVFATRSGGGLFFRVDVLDTATNQVYANDDFESTDEDTAVAFTVLDNDEDPSGGPLTVATVDTSGLVGHLTATGNGSFSYDPGGEFDGLAAGATATVTFRYTASGGVVASSTAAGGQRQGQ